MNLMQPSSFSTDMAKSPLHPDFSARSQHVDLKVCVRNDTEVMMMRENSSDGPGGSAIS